MTNEATEPDLTSEPDPDRAGAGVASRVGRFLGLVRKLIDYGKQLANTLQQQPPAEVAGKAARCFGTLHIALILARITRGLHLAVAFEIRLAHLAVHPPRPPASERLPSERLPSRRTPRPARQSRRNDDAEAILAQLPTAEAIAADITRRPLTAVLLDICSDLGITPAHPQWQELIAVIEENGGNLALLFRDLRERTCVKVCFPSDSETAPSIVPLPPGWQKLLPLSPPAVGTGPPPTAVSKIAA